MKQLATIGAVVALLLVAALFYGKRDHVEVKDDVDPPIGTVVPITQTPSKGTPKTSAELNGTLTLKAGISNAYLLHGNPGELYASFDTTAVDHQGAERPPINLAVVIDRSGSMSGEKFDNVKAAASRLVGQLEAGDRIALVSYGSDVTVDFPSSLMTEENRSRLLQVISRMVEGGGTNLSGGFQAGYSEVSRWKKDDYVNRVVLMSDGHANVGMTSSRELTKLSTTSLSGGISVSTIGVGLDYNEDLMAAMANSGAGNYYFIDRAETTATIFEKELKGLMSTVARNAVLIIRLSPGVKAVGVYGLNYRQEGDQLYVSMAEFRAKEMKSLLARLDVSGITQAGQAPILNVSLSYEDTVNQKPTHVQASLQSVLTSDASLLDKGIDAEVIARVQQVEVAKSMEEAMDLYSKGKAQEAAQRIERTQSDLREVRKRVALPRAARYDKAEAEMDQLQVQMGATAPSSNEGKTMIKKSKARSNDIMNSAELF